MQYCHKVLRLFYDFRAFFSMLHIYSSSENLYTPYLCVGEHSRPCLRQVYIALAQSDKQLHLIICRSDSRVWLVGQSSEGVPGLASPSIHSPPMTCLRFRLSIASLAGTLLGYDAGLLLTLQDDSEPVFENYWSPISHSSVGSACRLFSP